MPIEAPLGPQHGQIVVGRGALAGLMVALAMAASTIVLSEPAVADVLMAGVIFAVPLLGAARFGMLTTANLAAWLVIVALGIGGTWLSATFDTAIKHQLVTLFLALGSVVLAGYIAKDPLPRFNLVMWAYTLACLVATLAALLGYFRLLPEAYDLFTSYGRARGTFKDPNVFGAALVPAITFAAWIMLRETACRALFAAGLALLLALGLLISFSRGAWVSAIVALVLMAWVLFVRSRRRSDFKRFGLVALIGTAGVLIAFGAAMQIDEVRKLLEERASLDQSYDQGPEGRFGGQDKARNLILENPLGIGTNTFREVYHHEEPHNVYLSMFLNAGWIGGLAYVLSVAATLFAGLKLSFRSSALQGPLLVSTAAFAAMAFEGAIIDSDHWRHFFIVMACVWGLVDATAPRPRSGRRRRATD